MTGHTDKIWALAATPRGDLIASGGKDATVWLWRAHNGERIDPPLRNKKRWVKSLAFSPDEAQLAVGYDNGTVVLWRVGNHQQTGKALRGQREPINSLAYSPDGRYLASGSTDHTVVIFDVRAGAIVQKYSHRDAVNEVDISPDGRLSASSGDDGTIIVRHLDAETQPELRISGDALTTEHVRFSPDSKFVYWFDGKRIVDWQIGAPQNRRAYLQGHVGDINGMTFSPDGRMIASATMDRDVVLWDVHANQRLPRSLTGHSDIAWKAVFARNGEVVASSSNDKTVRLWDVSRDHWMARACAIANRNFTSEEWTQLFPGERWTDLP